MSAQRQEVPAALVGEIEALYRQLLETWNQRNAREFAALFEEDANLIGFDGSPIDGRANIERLLGEIFRSHQTASYVGKVREVRFLTPDVALLRAVAGMIPPGGSDLNPAVNSVQALVAANRDGQWRISLYQNTRRRSTAGPRPSRR